MSGTKSAYRQSLIPILHNRYFSPRPNLHLLRHRSRLTSLLHSCEYNTSSPSIGIILCISYSFYCLIALSHSILQSRRATIFGSTHLISSYRLLMFDDITFPFLFLTSIDFHFTREAEWLHCLVLFSPHF